MHRTLLAGNPTVNVQGEKRSNDTHQSNNTFKRVTQDVVAESAANLASGLLRADGYVLTDQSHYDPTQGVHAISGAAAYAGCPVRKQRETDDIPIAVELAAAHLGQHLQAIGLYFHR